MKARQARRRIAMSDDFPGDEDKSPMPEERFPDGFGMSVEDVRALLAKKHDVSVPQDDPILMQVTILQVFLEAQARLQKSMKQPWPPSWDNRRQPTSKIWRKA